MLLDCNTSACRYYKDQVPLSLAPDEMEQVVNTVVHPPPGDHETHLIASKILIKLLIDIYCGVRFMCVCMYICMLCVYFVTNTVMNCCLHTPSPFPPWSPLNTPPAGRESGVESDYKRPAYTHHSLSPLVTIPPPCRPSPLILLGISLLLTNHLHPG